MTYRHIVQPVVALALLLGAAQAQARNPELGVVIASQGNQALREIRSDLALALARPRPALPARAARVMYRAPAGSAAAARCAE